MYFPRQVLYSSSSSLEPKSSIWVLHSLIIVLFAFTAVNAWSIFIAVLIPPSLSFLGKFLLVRITFSSLYVIFGNYGNIWLAGSVVKTPPASPGGARDVFDPCVGKIPWSRKWQPTPVFLPGKSMDREEKPSGLQSMGSQRVSHMTEHMWLGIRHWEFCLVSYFMFAASFMSVALGSGMHGYQYDPFRACFQALHGGSRVAFILMPFWRFHLVLYKIYPHCQEYKQRIMCGSSENCLAYCLLVFSTPQPHGFTPHIQRSVFRPRFEGTPLQIFKTLVTPSSSVLFLNF